MAEQSRGRVRFSSNLTQIPDKPPPVYDQSVGEQGGEETFSNYQSVRSVLRKRGLSNGALQAWELPVANITRG